MTGRGGRGRGGRGQGGRNGRGRGGRGHNYTGSGGTSKKGLCSALGGHVFDYGQKAAADLMRTSWEKLVEYSGTTYGQDICNELQNKQNVTLPQPLYTAAVLQRHAAREAMIRTAQINLQTARTAQEAILQAAVTAGQDANAPMNLAILQNEIAQANFEQQQEVPIELTDAEKTQHSNEWRDIQGAELPTHQTPRTGIFTHPRTVHPNAQGQNEAGHGLGHGQHIV